VERAHDAGVLVAALAGTAEHARRSNAKGVDLIVAQGTEAGGHTGTISTMVLVPEVVDAVAPTPVLAAGGIGRGSQIAAAFALGAEGVWCGSIWLTTAEAETDPAVQQKFLAASSSDTVRSRSLTGKPARMLRSAWTDAWEEAGAPSTLPMPDQTMLTAAAQQRINRHAGDAGSGAQELATYFVGQIVGSMTAVRPARQVMLDLVTDYADAAERFVGYLGD
jgi:NAD(P)H-dependent flavin oxidoreductase YrpB (nitropropane dioxygenase family)